MKLFDLQPIIDGSSDGLSGEGRGSRHPNDLKTYGAEVLMLSERIEEGALADGSVVSEQLANSMVSAVPLGRKHLLGSPVPADKSQTPAELYFQDKGKPEHTYIGRHDAPKH